MFNSTAYTAFIIKVLKYNHCECKVFLISLGAHVKFSISKAEKHYNNVKGFHGTKRYVFLLLYIKLSFSQIDIKNKGERCYLLVSFENKVLIQSFGVVLNLSFLLHRAALLPMNSIFLYSFRISNRNLDMRKFVFHIRLKKKGADEFYAAF